MSWNIWVVTVAAFIGLDVESLENKQDISGNVGDGGYDDELVLELEVRWEVQHEEDHEDEQGDLEEVEVPRVQQFVAQYVLRAEPAERGVEVEVLEAEQVAHDCGH